MKILAHRIKRELNLGESTQCAVYEDELKRLWPLNRKEREAKIAQFAEEYGFRLRFYRKGLRAIFDKWPRPKRRL
jgi:hypothetical protein